MYMYTFFFKKKKIFQRIHFQFVTVYYETTWSLQKASYENAQTMNMTLQTKAPKLNNESITKVNNERATNRPIKI